jgi:hypothetical protein
LKKKIFKGLKEEDITKLSTIIKKKKKKKVKIKIKIKSSKRIEIKEIYHHKDQINRVRIGKFPYNINKENKIQCILPLLPYKKKWVYY